MNPPDLEKLRRFCLTIALILITYVCAGITIDTVRSVSVLGLPVLIIRPDLIVIGLIIASIYGTLRYGYYGFLRTRSPRKQRNKFLRNFGFASEGKRHGQQVYVGPPLDPSAFQNLQEELLAVYPELPKLGAIASKSHLPSGQVKKIHLIIPKGIHRAAWFEDFDYSAPIWLNIAAISLAITYLLVSVWETRTAPSYYLPY